MTAAVLENARTAVAVDVGFLDDVLGEREGFVAVAYGYDGFWPADGGSYTHPPGQWVETRYRWPAERDVLAREADRELATRRVDVYFCPALRVSDARHGFGGKHGTNALSPDLLWADADTPPDPALLVELGARAVISGSDGHQHVYVRLAEPVSVAVHRRLNRALAQRLGADAKWSDDALLRVPGTLNHKTDPPAPVVAEPRPTAVWDVDTLAALLGVDLSAVDDDEPSPIGDVVTPEAPPVPLPERVRMRLAHVPGPNERSEAHHALVGACRDAGLTIGQTLAVAETYGPSVDKYGPRLAAQVARSWGKVDDPRAMELEPANGAQDGAQHQDGAAASMPLNLPAEFWEARPALRHIRQAAWSRGASPDAVLGAALARESAYLNPADVVELDSEDGAAMSAFVILYGGPGTGKGRSMRCAADLVPVPLRLADEFRERPLGSGEGVTEAYYGLVPPPPGPDGKPGKGAKVHRQVRSNVLFVLDEGEALVKIITGRSGNTIAQTIRSAWSGEVIGQANASAERDRQLDRGGYSIGLVVGFQPDTIAPLFDPGQVGGGTPHRFLYLRAVDPSAPDRRPDWPGPLITPQPVDESLKRQWSPGTPTRYELTDETIRAAIWAQRLAVLREQATVAEQDTHAVQYRGRVAAHLARWDGRTAVTGADWELAGMVMATSAAVRDSAIEHGHRRSAAEQEARTRGYVERAVRTQVATLDAAEHRVAERTEALAGVLARKVRDNPQGVTHRTVKDACNARRRDVFGDALAEILARGWVERRGPKYYPGSAAADVPES